jgi:hypothetical protein
VIRTDVVTRISLTIFTARRQKVLTIRNVDTRRGARVPALVPGRYLALWTLTDANGDTRLAATRFIEQRGGSGAGPLTRIRCRFVGGGRIRCAVSFPNYRQIRGSVAMRLSRGGALVGLGHAGVRQGQATITTSPLLAASGGSWRATLVLSGPHIEPVTIQARVRGL